MAPSCSTTAGPRWSSATPSCPGPRPATVPAGTARRAALPPSSPRRTPWPCSGPATPCSSTAPRLADPERLVQAGPAGGGHFYPPAAVGAPDPAQLDEPVQQPAAERAGQVVVLLAPVHAVADQRPARRDLHPELVPERLPGRGQGGVDLVPRPRP